MGNAKIHLNITHYCSMFDYLLLLEIVHEPDTYIRFHAGLYKPYLWLVNYEMLAGVAHHSSLANKI